MDRRSPKNTREDCKADRNPPSYGESQRQGIRRREDKSRYARIRYPVDLHWPAGQKVRKLSVHVLSNLFHLIHGTLLFCSLPIRKVVNADCKVCTESNRVQIIRKRLIPPSPPLTDLRPDRETGRFVRIVSKQEGLHGKAGKEVFGAVQVQGGA